MLINRKAYYRKQQVRDADRSLVIWGSNLQSTVGEGKFTKIVSNMIKIPPYINSVIVGWILSDGWVIFASATNKNARLGFLQSLDRSGYVLFVFNKWSHYCSSNPHLTKRLRAVGASPPVLVETHPVLGHMP